MKHKSREHLAEELILLFTLFKWLLLSLFIGAAAGAATAGFLMLLETGIGAAESYSFMLFLLPVAFFLSSLLISKLAPTAEGHGTEKVIQAIHQNHGKIDIKVIPVKLLATLVTIIPGGSAGKEGPCAQIGGGIASLFASLFRMTADDRRHLVICGVSAGFAGVFGTPIAGAIFAAEVLYVGKFSYAVMLSALFSSYISFFVNRALGIAHHNFLINLAGVDSFLMVWKMLLFGIFIGLTAILFIKILNETEKFFHKKLNIWKPLKGLVGGAAVVLLVFGTGDRSFLGLGTELIDNAIHTIPSGVESLQMRELFGWLFEPVSRPGPFDFITKMFATSFTLGSGGSGGILTPLFFIGAAAGSSWAQLLNEPVGLYAAIGMVTLLAACANTPLAAIMIAMELFGVQIGAFASIACAVSYMIVGHRSVYPTQILAMSKSSHLDMNINFEIGDDKPIGFRTRHRFIRWLLFRRQDKKQSRDESLW